MIRRLVLAASVLATLATIASAQTVDELIEKNIKAKGGREKILALKTLRTTGKMVMGQGMEAPFTMSQKRPRAQRMEFSFQGLSGVQAYDGKNAWMVMPFSGKKDPEAMTAEDTKEMDEQADFDGPLFDYKEKGHKVELVGKEQIEGTDVYKLKLTLKGGDVRYIYLDSEYFLEIRTEGKRTMRGTEQEFESSIGDYKEVEGYMMPHAIENGVKGSQQKQKITIEKVEINPTLADSLFAMPAGTSPATARAAADWGMAGVADSAKAATATTKTDAKPAKSATKKK